MEYINKNFLALKDIESVDDHISSLTEEKNVVAAELKARVSTAPNLHSIPSKVTQLIEELSTQKATPTIEDVDLLLQTYGELAFLVQLKEMVQKRALLEETTLTLQRAAALEERLFEVNSSTEMPELIRLFKETSCLLDSGDVSEPVKRTLEQLKNDLTQNRRNALSKILQTRLSEIKWLSSKEEVSIESAQLASITQCFRDLIDLQSASQTPMYPATWWGVDILLQPFGLRFNFHFREDTKANRISKPEWAFNYVEDFLADHLPTIELVIGDSLVSIGRIAVFEVITSVLQPVREKLAELIQLINSKIDLNQDDSTLSEKNGRLLSHLIFESTSFDQRLRNAYKYNPHVADFNVVPEKKWMGLTGDVLLSTTGENDPVVNWLNLELQLAKKRFEKEIIGAPNAFLIDNDFSADSKHKESSVLPSYSAYGLMKLFENLTSHFETLIIVKYQLKYVSRIQLLLLDEYLEAVTSQFRQFCDSNDLKMILSLLPGGTKIEQVKSLQVVTSNGLKALETLAGLLCLARFIVFKMKEWGDELIFIQLWDYYKSISTKSEFESSIFESTIEEYEAICHKIMERFESFFRKQIKEELKGFVNNFKWNELSDGVEEVSSQLSNFVTMMDTYMSYLKKNLSEIDYFLLATKVSDALALTLLEYVVRNNKFSKSGVAKLKMDFEFLKSLFASTLLLRNESIFNNHQNHLLAKVSQSIELLGRFDVETAKVMKTLFTDGEGIRAQFDNTLADLTDEDIRDLLYRIV